MDIELILEKVKGQVKETLNEAQKDIESKVAEVVKQGGYATKEQYEAIKAAQDAYNEKLEKVLKEHGTMLDDIKGQMITKESVIKSPVEVLYEHKERIAQIRNQAMGNISFDLTQKDGIMYLTQDTKKTMPEATIDGVLDGGNTASISEALNSAAVLRMGAESPILNAFAEDRWIFGLANTTTTNSRIVVYWEEDVANNSGSPSLVMEGAEKPIVNYKYKLVAQPYKKVAGVLSITDEFEMDFGKLYQDIINKLRRDVMLKMQSNILTNVINNATAYNTSADFIAIGGVDTPNPHDAVVAMATQVNAETFSERANVAIFDPYTKGRIGVEKSVMLTYLNKPEEIAGLTYLGHAGVTSGHAVVGDLSQYNILLRGGMRVRMGYNGEDMVHNMFTVVVEQYYYDYISDLRKPAIVTGDLTAVMQAIAATT